MEWQKFETAIGSPLYVCEMPWRQGVSSAVVIKAGTRDEEWPKEAGLAHALEHMLFQGAGKFRNSLEFAADIELTGGNLNAFTSKEGVACLNVVPSEDFERALLNLSQQISAPIFPEGKIQKEMSAILQEINMYNDRPDFRTDIIFEEALYHGHPLERCSLGEAEIVKNFCRDNFVKFFNRFYHPANFAFVVAGAINAPTAEHLFNHIFQRHLFERTGRTVSVLRPTNFPDIYNLQQVVEKKDIEQAHIQFGWLMPPASSRETFVLKFFREMIGGGMSFPLFQEVRDKRGLCYTVQAPIDSFSDAGSFSIYIGTNIGKVDEAIKVSLDVIRASAANSDLLEAVKKMMSGRMRLQFENPTASFTRALGDITRGNEPESLDSLLRKINSVTIEEIEAAVNKYLISGKMTKAMILPRK